jgi:hypothetical protein
VAEHAASFTGYAIVFGVPDAGGTLYDPGSIDRTHFP